MPQLMPLFWVISNMFIFMFVMMLVLLYGDGFMKFHKLIKLNSYNYFYWCW